jgi:hypothetical protein
MRLLTPLALLATVVAAFIVAKGCLPKDDLGSRAASSAVPGFSGESEPKPRTESPQPKPATPR